MRRTLSQAFATLDAVVALIGMLAFVIFVISIVGLHLFWACHEECHGTQCVYTRGNFGTLLNAYLAIFQLFSRYDPTHNMDYPRLRWP